MSLYFYKWEYFIVVAGYGLNQEQNNNDELVEYKVFDQEIEALHMIPRWMHNNINLRKKENLVMLMACNKVFIPEKPDMLGETI